MKVVQYLLFVVVVLLAFGCAPSTSQYLANKSYVIYPQNVMSEEGEDLQKQSMESLLKSFKAYRWEIHGIDKVNHTVTAEVCRRGEYCSEMIATVKIDGSVSLTRTPGQVLSEDDATLLRRWLGNLKRGHLKFMEEDSQG